MFDLIATILAFFYDLTHNYALAIALLTLSIMVLVTPLTIKSTRSMLQMQKLQPEIKRLQAEHKNDRQKLNEELMKFYQENKINPLGGCLPLLIQMPIFFILYRVLSKLTATCTAEGIADGACTTIGNFSPSYIDKSTQLWQDLTATNEMLSFGIDLSKSAVQRMSDDFVAAIPYLILILLVACTSYVQQWQISARSQNSQMLPQQQMLLRLLPAFFAVISLTLPAGLVVYFLVSNLYRIAQQYYITRSLYRDRGADGLELTDGAKEPKPKPEPTRGRSAPKPAPSSKTNKSTPSTQKGSSSKGSSSRPAPKPKPSGSTRNGSAASPGKSANKQPPSGS